LFVFVDPCFQWIFKFCDIVKAKYYGQDKFGYLGKDIDESCDRTKDSEV